MLLVSWVLAAWLASHALAVRDVSDEQQCLRTAASPLVPFDAQAAKRREAQLYSAGASARELAADEVRYLIDAHVDLLGHMQSIFEGGGFGDPQAQPYLAMAASMRALCTLTGGEVAEDECELVGEFLEMTGKHGQLRSVTDWAAEVANLPDQQELAIASRYSVYELAMVGTTDHFSQNQPFPDPVLWSGLLEGSRGATVVELSGGADATWSLQLAKMVKMLSLPVDKVVVTEFAGTQSPLPIIKQERGPRVELIHADNSRLSDFIGAGRSLGKGEADVVFARNALCDCGDPLITCGGIAKDSPKAVCGFLKNVLSLLKPDGVAVFVHTTSLASRVISTVRQLRSTQGLSATLAPSFARSLYPKLQGLQLGHVDEKMLATLVMSAGLGSAELACEQFGSLE